MANQKNNKTIQGKKLRQLRLTVGVSLTSLYKITGIATATLSNLEKGLKSYHGSTIDNLSNAFGIDKSLFFDLEKELPSQDELINSLGNYAKLRNPNIAIRSLLRKNLTAFIIDDYISNHLLDKFQNVQTIREVIQSEYSIELKSAQTSKILSTRFLKGILERKYGEKKGTFEYRRIV